jgi:hypothetical protein
MNNDEEAKSWFVSTNGAHGDEAHEQRAMEQPCDFGLIVNSFY